MAKTIGLDIGATTIKLVDVDKGPKGYVLNSALTSPTPSRGLMSESPLDQEEMAQAIIKIVSESKTGAKSLNLALPENQVYTRVIEMPVLADKELSSAILYEAEQYIPVPLNNIVMDWKVLQRPLNPVAGDKMDVLLVGAPTALVTKYERIISLTGYSAHSLETEILAAIRALVIGGENFPNTLIVNIGSVSTSLAIIRKGVLVFTYTIATGGVAINRAIASDFGFSMEQAEEYKKAYGVSQKMFGGRLGQATEPILHSILEEVKKALAFYKGKFKEEAPIAQILLSGGGAKLQGIDIYFAEHSGVETVIGNPWKVLSEQNLPKEILDNAPDYTVAMGLAMKDYE